MHHCLICGRRGRCEVGINLCNTYSLLRHLAPLDYRRHTDIIMRRAVPGHCPMDVEAACAPRRCTRHSREWAQAS